MSRWARWNDDPTPQRVMSQALSRAISLLAPCDPEMQIYLMTVRSAVERGDDGWEEHGRAALEKFQRRGIAEMSDSAANHWQTRRE
jgi:hypothetical protein